ASSARRDRRPHTSSLNRCRYWTILGLLVPRDVCSWGTTCQSTPSPAWRPAAPAWKPDTQRERFVHPSLTRRTTTAALAHASGYKEQTRLRRAGFAKPTAPPTARWQMPPE